YSLGSKDLDGRPRIVGGSIDLGSYEFQPGIDGLFIGWLERYQLTTDGSADHTDTDGDGIDNYHEWLAGSDPTNLLSAPPRITFQPVSLRITPGSDAIFSVTASGTEPLTIQWLFNGTNELTAGTNFV